MQKEHYINNYQVYEPNINEVPDCEITKELWILTPVKIKLVGKGKSAKYIKA